jgi:hypothetical protein
MIAMRKLILPLSLILVLSACGAPVSPAATPTLIPTLPPTSIPTDAAVTLPPATQPGQFDPLLAQVSAAIAPGTYDQPLNAFPITVPQGFPPLVVVHSAGLPNFQTIPVPGHFIGLYKEFNGSWTEVAHIDFGKASDAPSPDFLGVGTVRQVFISPDRVWLEVSGGVGAHGSVYGLFAYDGASLRPMLSAPFTLGYGEAKDLDNDSVPEVTVDVSDEYVFCYACSVRNPMLDVYVWDSASAALIKLDLQDIPAGQADPALTAANNTAVAMARAGLWKDARSKIGEIGGGIATSVIVQHNLMIISAIEGLAVSYASSSGYPILSQVLYGDFEAAVALMRPTPPEQIFSAPSPLITGTPAEGFEGALASNLISHAESALSFDPNRPAATFLLGWGQYINDPASAEARTNIAKAAQLAPDDAFYAACAAYFK